MGEDCQFTQVASNSYHITLVVVVNIFAVAVIFAMLSVGSRKCGKLGHITRVCCSTTAVVTYNHNWILSDLSAMN